MIGGFHENRNGKRPLSRAAALALALLLSGCGAAETAPRADVYVSEESLAGRESSAQTIPAAEDADAVGQLAAVFSDAAPASAAAGISEQSAARASSAASSSVTANAGATGTAALADDGRDYLEVLFLGDSQFSNARGSGTEIAEFVRDYLHEGDCRIYNLGISGTSASLKREERNMTFDNWTSPSFLGMAHLLHGDVSDGFLEKQYPEIAAIWRQIDKDKLDYIVVDYGTNDFLGVAEIFGEEDLEDPADFGPAYLTSLRLLRAACPQATILCCTPCYSQFFAKDGAYLGDGNSLSNGYGVLANYVGTIESFYGEVENTLFVDMYHGSRMNLDAYTADEYLSDGIHLTELGRKAYGKVVARTINKHRGTYTDEWRVIEIDDL